MLRKMTFFDVDEFQDKNLVWSSDSNSDDFEDDASVDHNDEAHEHEKRTCVNESYEGYEDDVKELTNKLEERKTSKVEEKKTAKFYDKPDIVKELHDDPMYQMSL